MGSAGLAHAHPPRPGPPPPSPALTPAPPQDAPALPVRAGAASRRADAATGRRRAGAVPSRCATPDRPHVGPCAGCGAPHPRPRTGRPSSPRAGAGRRDLQGPRRVRGGGPCARNAAKQGMQGPQGPDPPPLRARARIALAFSYESPHTSDPISDRLAGGRDGRGCGSASSWGGGTAVPVRRCSAAPSLRWRSRREGGQGSEGWGRRSSGHGWAIGARGDLQRKRLTRAKNHDPWRSMSIGNTDGRESQ